MIDDLKTFGDWKDEYDEVLEAIKIIHELQGQFTVSSNIDVNSQLKHVENKLINYIDTINEMKIG